MTLSSFHNRLLRSYTGLLLIFVVFSMPGYATTLNFRHYSVEEGLANSTVYYVFQDSEDFIWIATESGVNRFDGNSFELFTMDNGLSDNEVLQIHEDSSGKIWFLTLNGKPSYFFKGSFYNTSNDPLLKSCMGHGSLTSFYEDSSGRLWFSTNQNKLIQVDANKRVHIYSSPEESFVNAIVLETQRKDVVVFSGKSLFKFQKDKFLRVPIKEYPLSQKSVFLDSERHKIFFLSRNGLMELHNFGTTKVVDIHVKLPATVSSLLLNKNELWIGTMGRGLILHSFRDKRSEDHLKNINISHVLKDRQGNVWISTIGSGIYFLSRQVNFAKHLTIADGLATGAVTAVRKSGGNLLLGYSNGSLDILKNEKLRNIIPQPKNSYNPVKKIYSDTSTGSLWYASENNLIKMQRGGRQINLLNDPKWSSYALKSFSLDPDGHIAIALASGVYILDADQLNTRHSSINLSTAPNFKNRAFAVHFEEDGGLWFSNIQGLHYFKNGLLKQPYKIYSKLRHRITDIATLPKNMTICASYGFGVFILKDAKLLRTITTKDGLQSNICKKLFVEGKNVWVVTGKGISKVEMLENGKTKISNYNTATNLLSNEINDIYVEQDTAYIASNSGVTIFRETRQSAETSLPPVVIRSISVNNRTASIEKVKHLSHLENNVNVTFVCMDYSHPEQVVYGYRTSLKEPWIETNEQTIEFSSLKPGRYEIEIRAKSIYANWTEPTLVQVNIDAPFWLRWWFIGTAGLFVLLLLFLLIQRYYKIKQIKEKEKLLTKTRIIALEQQALQAMMNPHFIFNVMNSIQYFINTRDNTMANQLLTGFARLIRKNLDICNKSYISVEEELTYLNLYLSLEKLRFGDRMSYTITTNTNIDLAETYIPSMLLQPYVENAIWHGIMPMNKPGELCVEIENANDQLILTIKDNGIGIDESLRSKNSDHISRGMQLTRQRISLLNKFNKDSISISVAQQATGGTIVTVIVPLRPFTHS